MELAPGAVRSLGWAQSVGTATVGVPCRPAHLTPQAGRTDDGPEGTSHSDPQSVQPRRVLRDARGSRRERRFPKTQPR